MNFRTIGIFLVCLTIFGSIALMQRLQTRPHGKTIAIIQTASHPALDAVKDGFREEIKKIFPECHIVIHNGQGSLDQLHMIAKNVAYDTHIDAIVAIATPAAQAVAHVEHEKPILIAAVTDPQAAGVAQQNICGALDMIDCQKELQLIKALVPTIKTMAILYNIGEVNAVSLATTMKQLCAKENIICKDFCVTHEIDMLPLLEQRLHECDVIWAPLDNSVASSISLLAHKTLQARKPFFVSDNLLVGDGALAAAGVNYHESGKQVAHIAQDLLNNNKKPHELPCKKPTIDTFWINKKVMQQLGLSTSKASNLAIEWVES